jgi:hypothetical protein
VAAWQAGPSMPLTVTVALAVLVDRNGDLLPFSWGSSRDIDDEI